MRLCCLCVCFCICPSGDICTCDACYSLVHPAEPACSSSWHLAASVPPAEPQASSAHCPAAPITAALPAPPVLESNEKIITLPKHT